MYCIFSTKRRAPNKRSVEINSGSVSSSLIKRSCLFEIPSDVYLSISDPGLILSEKQVVCGKIIQLLPSLPQLNIYDKLNYFDSNST